MFNLSTCQEHVSYKKDLYNDCCFIFDKLINFKYKTLVLHIITPTLQKSRQQIPKWLYLSFTSTYIFYANIDFFWYSLIVIFWIFFSLESYSYPLICYFLFCQQVWVLSFCSQIAQFYSVHMLTFIKRGHPCKKINCSNKLRPCIILYICMYNTNTTIPLFSVQKSVNILVSGKGDLFRN